MTEQKQEKYYVLHVTHEDDGEGDEVAMMNLAELKAEMYAEVDSGEFGEKWEEDLWLPWSGPIPIHSAVAKLILIVDKPRGTGFELVK